MILYWGALLLFIAADRAPWRILSTISLRSRWLRSGYQAMLLFFYGFCLSDRWQMKRLNWVCILENESPKEIIRERIGQDGNFLHPCAKFWQEVQRT